MRALIIPNNGKAEVKEIEDISLEFGDDWFDIASRKIGEDMKSYDIYCEDSGLFKADNNLTAISINDYFMHTLNNILVGKLVILKRDKYGNAKSLSKADIEYLKKYLLKAETTYGFRNVILMC